MNRICICCLVLTLSLGSAAWSQEKREGAGTGKAVAGLEEQVRKAVIKADMSVLEQYLADDFVGIGPNGVPEDKSHTIQDLKNGTVKYSAIDVTEENVRMYGNTGIYNGRGNVKMTINGQPLTADVRVTIVWVKQNGQWKRVSFQATQVQPPQEVSDTSRSPPGVGPKFVTVFLPRLERSGQRRWGTALSWVLNAAYGRLAIPASPH